MKAIKLRAIGGSQTAWFFLVMLEIDNSDLEWSPKIYMLLEMDEP